ncbi:MAG TPA: hypothetical protein VG457_03425 [Planctomycetota bacterium]|nr:hypothetical protein [Planctomycetota bacterium]
MTLKTVTLKDGPGICKLLPIDGEEGFDQARVLSGTFGTKGDILRKPADLTWEEAVEEIAPGLTALSPFDLELVRDVVTGHSFIPEGGLEELCTLYENVAVNWESAFDEAGYLEALSRLLSKNEEAAQPAGTTQRRRKVDVA